MEWKGRFQVKSITLYGTKYHIDMAGQIDGCIDKINSNIPTLMLCRGDLSSRAYLETVIHEGLHACFPGIAEDRITQSGKDLARLLWGLGYRHVKRKGDR